MYFIITCFKIIFNSLEDSLSNLIILLLDIIHNLNKVIVKPNNVCHVTKILYFIYN